jgi:hypothetical protein
VGAFVRETGEKVKGMKIKIWIINHSELTVNKLALINNWFELNLFEIPFMPQVGMKIDLDDFYREEDYLAYAEIHDIIILRDYVELHCIV